jgi:N-acetylglucosamine kinase-like BadF-type ATPase
MAVASRSYETVLTRLLKKSGLGAKEIFAVGVGAAGAGRDVEQRRIERSLRRLVPKARIFVDSDGMIALLGAIGVGAGIIVIAGTGSFVLGIDHHGRRARGGGWGPLLGDEGSGSTMGREAIQSVLQAEDGRRPATALRTEVFAHFRVRNVGELITRIYRKPPSAREFARLWPRLLRSAQKGDSVARRILRKGGEELAETVEAVARKLAFGGRPISLVLAGGLLTQESLLRRTVLSRLRKSLPGLRLVEPFAEPEIGALYLILRSLKENLSIRFG